MALRKQSGDPQPTFEVVAHRAKTGAELQELAAAGADKREELAELAAADAEIGPALYSEPVRARLAERRRRREIHARVTQSPAVIVVPIDTSRPRKLMPAGRPRVRRTGGTHPRRAVIRRP